MNSLLEFITRRPVVAYFVLTFVISWGGFLLLGARGLFAGTDWETDTSFQLAVAAMLAGPPIAGLVMIGITSGRAGFRDLLARLTRWRVGARWYMVALLTAPILMAAILFTLSLFSTEFLPAIVDADNVSTLLLAGLAVGIVGGLVEELGWTGFAIPRLRLRYSVLQTGILVGILWTAWHLLQMTWVGLSSAEAIPLAMFLTLYFASSVASLTAFRVLMVWVYDRTESLLVAILMHASLIASTLFILAPPTTGGHFLIYSWLSTVALWLVVAVVSLVNRWQFLQPELMEPTVPLKREGIAWAEVRQRGNLDRG
jgi:uncharacterized protein